MTKPEVLASLACLAGALLAGSPLAGQEPDQHLLEIVPVYANAFPVGELAAGTSSPDGAETRATLDAAAGFGLHLRFRVTDRLGVEVMGLHVPTEVSVPQASGDLAGLSLATFVNLQLAAVGSSYRFGSERSRLRPFATAGAGVKGYGLASDADFTWFAGGGVTVETGWIADVRLAGRNYMSVFDNDAADKLQNDLVFSAGAVLSVF